MLGVVDLIAGDKVDSLKILLIVFERCVLLKIYLHNYYKIFEICMHDLLNPQPYLMKG